MRGPWISGYRRGICGRFPHKFRCFRLIEGRLQLFLGVPHPLATRASTLGWRVFGKVHLNYFYFARTLLTFLVGRAGGRGMAGLGPVVAGRAGRAEVRDAAPGIFYPAYRE